jgi:hypothetical protein
MSGSMPRETFNIDDAVYAEWQDITDILAMLLQLPAALIMHVGNGDISVLVTSASEGNPYQKGAKETLKGSGLYCERVIRDQKKLHIPMRWLTQIGPRIQTSNSIWSPTWDIRSLFPMERILVHCVF